MEAKNENNKCTKCSKPLKGLTDYNVNKHLDSCNDLIIDNYPNNKKITAFFNRSIATTNLKTITDIPFFNNEINQTQINDNDAIILLNPLQSDDVSPKIRIYENSNKRQRPSETITTLDQNQT